MNKAKIKWKTMVQIVMDYFEKIGFPVRGYVWTFEIGNKTFEKTNNPDDLHLHYHLALAVDRMQLKGGKIPAQLKFDTIWGRRTEIDFVKKNVKHYMAKYFAKNQWRAEGVRSYGMSKKFN